MANPAKTLLNFIADVGDASLFFLRTLAALPYVLLHPRLLMQQLYFIGVLSLIIIVVSGSFVGMVLALQGYTSLSNFGAEESLGVVVALSLVRELGPVVTALLFAGRAGSAVAAEIGMMHAKEQIAGIEMMAVDPMKLIVAPRFFAGVISVPLLTAIFNMMAIGICGGYLVGVVVLGVDAGSYWSQIQSSVDVFDDIANGVIKSLVFGIAISFIAVYQGYRAIPTTEGVSRATTNTVVISSLTILALDFVLTALMFGEV